MLMLQPTRTGSLALVARVASGPMRTMTFSLASTSTATPVIPIALPGPPTAPACPKPVQASPAASNSLHTSVGKAGPWTEPFSILTFNVQSSLCPKTPKLAAKGKLDFVVDLLGTHDVMCLQEVGMISDKPLPVVERAFDKASAKFLLHGPPQTLDNPRPSHIAAGVAVVVKNKWTILSVDRFESRAIAVQLKQGSWEVTVICAYLPSGLDATPITPSPGSKAMSKHHLAETIYAWASSHIQRSNDNFILAGDLNEARFPSDRWHPDPSMDVLAGRGLFLNKFLGDESRISDVARKLHPTALLPTRLGTPGCPTAARLDYILVPTRLCDKALGTWSMPTPETDLKLSAGLSDHVPVVASFKPNSARTPRSVAPELWTPNFLKVSGASAQQRAKLTRLANRKAANLLLKWPKKRGSPKTRITSMNAVADQFLTLMKKAVSTSLCAQSGPHDDAGYNDTPLHRLRKLRHRLGTLQQSVQLIRAGVRRSSTKAHRIAFGELQEVLGGAPGVRHDDLDGLDTLVAHLSTPEHILKLQDAWLSQRSANNHDRHLRDCFTGPGKHRGEFISLYLRGQSQSAIIDREVNEDNEVVWCASLYKKIVRRKVMGPMSTKVDLPGPYQDCFPPPLLCSPVVLCPSSPLIPDPVVTDLLGGTRCTAVTQKASLPASSQILWHRRMSVKSGMSSRRPVVIRLLDMTALILTSGN